MRRERMAGAYFGQPRFPQLLHGRGGDTSREQVTLESLREHSHPVGLRFLLCTGAIWCFLDQEASGVNFAPLCGFRICHGK